MTKLDKIKEDIGALKTYQGYLIAIIITIGAGTAKLYLDNMINVLFWIGIVGVITLSVTFIVLARYMHKKINEIEEL